MTDYIQWLLGQEEAPAGEEPAQEAAVPRRGLLPLGLGRRRAGPWGGWKRWGTAGAGESLSVEATPFGGSPRRAEEGPAAAVAAWAGTDPAQGSGGLLSGTMAPSIPLPGRETPSGEESGGAAALYIALGRLGRGARLAAGGQAPAPGAISRVEAFSKARGLDPWALDRCFEREARRYDNGFPLL